MPKHTRFDFTCLYTNTSWIVSIKPIEKHFQPIWEKAIVVKGFRFCSKKKYIVWFSLLYSFLLCALRIVYAVISFLFFTSFLPFPCTLPILLYFFCLIIEIFFETLCFYQNSFPLISWYACIPLCLYVKTIIFCMTYT